MRRSPIRKASATSWNGRQSTSDLPRVAQRGESLIEPRVFAGHAGIGGHRLAVDGEFGATVRELESAGGSRKLDVPALLALLAEIEFGADLDAVFGAQSQIRRDRCLLVFRKLEQCAFDADFLGKDLGEQRQRVDARIEHAETARLPDPALARMPLVHVFLPDDPAARQLAIAQVFARGVDARGAARMPGLVQREAAARGFLGEQCDLPRRGCRWLLEHHVFAGTQCRSAPRRNAPAAACRWRRNADREPRRACSRDPESSALRPRWRCGSRRPRARSADSRSVQGCVDRARSCQCPGVQSSTASSPSLAITVRGSP